MGMYDKIRCEFPLPGLPDPTGIEFQTKSLVDLGFFDDYQITEQGQLVLSDYDVEDRSDPNAEGLMKLVGCMTRIHICWGLVDFTGTLNFYGDANSGMLFFVNFAEGKTTTRDDEGNEIEVPEAEWFEYNAVFEGGNLISVERV